MQDSNCGTSLGCETCPLKASRRIGARGNEAAEFVIVGESPGVRELSAGVPFVGQSGQVLEGCIPKDVEVYVTTAVSCMPPMKDKGSVLGSMVSSCQGRLLDEIAKHPRKVILALGNGALWALTGDQNLKITQERGKIFTSPYASGGIVAAVHPAFLLRGGGSYKKFQEDIQLALSILKGEKIRGYIEPVYQVVGDEGAITVEGLLSRLSEATEAAADIETAGLDFMKDRILSLSIAIEPEIAYIIRPQDIHRFKDALESERIQWIWHNGKFDVKFLRRDGIEAKVDEDTMLLNYTLDETRGIHDLDTVASDVLGAPSHKDAVAQYVKGKNGSYANIPWPILCDYQAKDTSKTLQIKQVLRPRVAADASLELLYTCTLIPASEFLSRVEARGFMCDYTKWQENEARLKAEVERLNKEMNELYGQFINPGSPAQVAAMLYDHFKIPTRDRGTGKDILEKLPDHPAVRLVQKYRKAAKALSTYIYGLAENISDDDRAHSTYLLHGTATGRLASREPNLQNIPRDADLKGMFIPAPGYALVSGDASQAELRSLAQLSSCPQLKEIYTSTDRSLHKEVAAKLYGPNWNEEQLIRAKAVNFGIVYGRTGYTLAAEFDLPTREGQRMIDTWAQTYPVAWQFIQKCRNAGTRGQILTTCFGRKKRPGLVTEDNLQETQNEYANFPHQSIASDITLHVAMLIRPKLEALGAYIVNIVHDDIISEVPNNPDTITKVKLIYEEAFALIPPKWGLADIPFKVECKVMDRWGHKI